MKLCFAISATLLSLCNSAVFASEIGVSGAAPNETASPSSARADMDSKYIGVLKESALHSCVHQRPEGFDLLYLTRKPAPVDLGTADKIAHCFVETDWREAADKYKSLANGENIAGDGTGLAMACTKRVHLECTKDFMRNAVSRQLSKPAPQQSEADSQNKNIDILASYAMDGCRVNSDTANKIAHCFMERDYWSSEHYENLADGENIAGTGTGLAMACTRRVHLECTPEFMRFAVEIRTDGSHGGTDMIIEEYNRRKSEDAYDAHRPSYSTSTFGSMWGSTQDAVSRSSSGDSHYSSGANLSFGPMPSEGTQNTFSLPGEQYRDPIGHALGCQFNPWKTGC